MLGDRMGPSLGTKLTVFYFLVTMALNNFMVTFESLYLAWKKSQTEIKLAMNLSIS